MNDQCNYLNNKTKEKIEALTKICNEMLRFGQRFLILEDGLAVGKTLFAKEIAYRLADGIENNIHFFQLHDAYSYNNFIYGQQIKTEEGKILYKKGEGSLHVPVRGVYYMLRCLNASGSAVCRVPRTKPTPRADAHN